jgi:hypothetical protein
LTAQATYVLAAVVVALTGRYRPADAVVRRQLRVVAFAAAVMALCWGVGIGVKAFTTLVARRR